MSKVKERAQAARFLQDNETLQGILREIKERQVKHFLDAGSSTETREKAHVIIRALDEIDREIKSRLDDAAVEEHRERHRV